VKVRFQADADFNEDIVKGVLRREPRVDFRTATAAEEWTNQLGTIPF
jgi:hypothetical protein